MLSLAIALLQQGKSIDLTNSIAIHAAKISYEVKIPKADSIILSTARQDDAMIWTQDEDSEGIEGIKDIKK